MPVALSTGDVVLSIKLVSRLGERRIRHQQIRRWCPWPAGHGGAQGGPRARVDGARKDAELSVAAPPSPQASTGSRGAATPLAPPIAAARPGLWPQCSGPLKLKLGPGATRPRKVRVESRGSIRTARRDIDPCPDSEAPRKSNSMALVKDFVLVQNAAQNRF